MDLPETRYARSGELNIAYQVFGEGPLDVVFVPGIIFRIWTCNGVFPARSGSSSDLRRSAV
jgi:hypothetical protein